MPELPTVQVLPGAESAALPVFYYDLGDPVCYIAAERIISALGVAAEWEPVLGAEIRGVPGPADVERIAELARRSEIQRLRWPDGWPPDTRPAMLAATYAKRIGRGVAFSLAAFRQAFAGGRDLADPDTIVIAGAACEMHPTALLRAMETRAVGRALQDATRRAQRAGVASLPAIQAEGQIFSGEDAIESARRATEAGS